jgi:lipase maturation factor
VDWVAAPDYWLARLLVTRGLGVVYLVAFLVAVNQLRPLLGERGLLPIPRLVAAVDWREAPSLFHWRYSDRLATAVSWTGVVLAAAVVAGLPDRAPALVGMAVWLALWALYLSIVNVGQVFYAFGWESLLLEAGFLAIFLGPADWAPPTVVILLLRWLLLRVELGAGLIKLRGDPCWRQLTCLDHHHETQPMPNPLSWWFHRLPRVLHRVEVAANHVTQLVAPFVLLLPQPWAAVAGGLMIATQLWLMLSGNFSWLNLLTLILALAALDDAVLDVLPASPPSDLADPPAWFAAIALAVGALVVYLSRWPVANMISPGQRMNMSFNPLHLVNTYGAFGTVTRTRDEVVVEGTLDDPADDAAEWREYQFKGKPGDPRRRPRQVAPYHLRLDWMMWFAAMSPARGSPWLRRLLARLLEADAPTLRLLAHDPFAGQPPTAVRARLFHYRFTTRAERRATGAWWHRSLAGDYLPAVRRRSDPPI